MKLAGRLTLLFFNGFAAVLILQAVADARRELALYDESAWSGLRSAAQLLEDVVPDAQRSGDESVQRVLRNARERLKESDVRWVWLDAPESDPAAPHFDGSALRTLVEGQQVEMTREELGGRRLFVYAPVTRGGRKGAIELSRVLTRRRDFLRSLVVEQTVSILASLLLIATACLMVLSHYVTAPLRRLAEQARTIGTPRSPGSQATGRRDEIGELCRELDSLGGRYAESQLHLVTETTRRMADLGELHNANRLVTVGKLAASMAHELGTPLGVVQARAQMIAAGEVPQAELSKEAEVILRETQRMTRMVKEVLELARPKPPVKVPVDLGALGRQTISMLEPLARKRNVKLSYVGDSAPAMVLGDAPKLLQVLTNLAMNAAQAMHKGGTATFRVERRRARPPEGIEADYLAIDVCDEGEGIAPEVLPRIFDTFFTTKKEGEGTGLGLSVSFRIAREHGGWIGVESALGKGSCFTLYLPPYTAPSS